MLIYPPISTFFSGYLDPTQAPLTVWLNGGPGYSSLFGLFQENGPCHVDKNGNISSNPYSWSNVSNMLYIDQPTQVGFSYSIPIPAYVDTHSEDIIELPDNKCPDYALSTCGTYSLPNISLTATSADTAAPSLWAALQGFMGAFPQYSQNQFNLASESYGGQYGPIFSEYIENQNAKNLTGATNIPHNALLVGNGWFDSVINYQSLYNFTVSPGNTYDYAPFNASLSSELYNDVYGPGNCMDQMKDCGIRAIDHICRAADEFCNDQIFGIYNTLRRDVYDIRELNSDPSPPDFFVDYLNTPVVQSAVGAFQNYTIFSLAAFKAFDGTKIVGIGSVPYIKKLLGRGVTVVLYHGDADFICNWFAGEAVSVEVGGTWFSEAGYVNISTSDNIVHG